MKTPDEVFSGMSRIDYIKCDIEGYEVPVLPAMQHLIALARPILQIETIGENKTIIFNMLGSLGYKCFYLNGKVLTGMEQATDFSQGDLLFIPNEKIRVLSNDLFLN